MTKKQIKLARKYGTPEKFEEAIEENYCDLMITREEASLAINKYRRQWLRAKEKDTTNAGK
jgi:hypothetical protein